MKFFKCHSAKYKDNKVIFISEQFNEIGPDAFTQTDFDIIVLSDAVTAVSDHAFSGIHDCDIIIPDSVSDIGMLAFEGTGEGVTVVCNLGTPIYKFCEENAIATDIDVKACMDKARRIVVSQKSEEKLKATIESEKLQLEKLRKQADEILAVAKADAIAIKNRAVVEAEQIKTNAQYEAEKIRQEACEEAKRIKLESYEQAQKIKQEIYESQNTPSAGQSAYTVGNTVDKAKIGRVFVDEEHQYGSGTKKSVYAEPVHKPLNNTSVSSYSMSRLDEYDDELKNMNKQKKEKSNGLWNLFQD